MRALALVTLAATGLATLVGCGPTCQSTCEQVYTQCGITKQGRSSQQLERDCLNECNSAMRESGEVGDYNPFVRRTSNESIDLENDQQAVAWMDCVWETAPDASAEQCADLDPSTGFCAPI